MPTLAQTTPRPLPRIARFEKLGLGLFLHWGLYSQLGKGEWYQHHAQIPAKTYEKLQKKFTAADFDARAIARCARESGARYIVLTTRHHEGFSLYDARGLSKFDAPHSPAGRDLVAEFADACRAEGVVPFFYHTTLDWRWDSANCSEVQFNEYLDYLNASVEILCRHYGKIGGLWFDGNWSRPHADWKEDRLYATIRKYQPEAMIINNTGIHERGALGHPELDSMTFEQGLPKAPDRRGWPKYLAGEMCETMNNHWGIGARDFDFKGPRDVIEHFCACRKVGANYLMNIGPTSTGALPAYESAVLRMLGEWIRLSGELMYEAQPTEVRCSGRDFVLRGPKGHYYYFAHNLTQQGDAHVTLAGTGLGPRTLEGFPAQIKAARWMDDGSAIRFTQTKDKALAVMECGGFDYGDSLVVRIAELRVK